MSIMNKTTIKIRNRNYILCNKIFYHSNGINEIMSLRCEYIILKKKKFSDIVINFRLLSIEKASMESSLVSLFQIFNISLKFSLWIYVTTIQ